MSSPARIDVPMMAVVAENIIMAEPQKKPATVDEDTAAAGQHQDCSATLP
jgi:hypothetical protein